MQDFFLIELFLLKVDIANVMKHINYLLCICMSENTDPLFCIFLCSNKFSKIIDVS